MREAVMAATFYLLTIAFLLKALVSYNFTLRTGYRLLGGLMVASELIMAVAFGLFVVGNGTNPVISREALFISTRVLLITGASIMIVWQIMYLLRYTTIDERGQSGQ